METEKKFTRGEAKTSFIEIVDWYSICVGIGDVVIHCESSRISIEEQKANAELICEAFNVANRTGLRPLEMEKALKKAVKRFSS